MCSFAYHGEGLWITQPDFSKPPHLHGDLDDVISQLHILKSPWLNHECATKQMAGYSFGTYLPPLYTVESAKVVADNIEIVQAKMDETAVVGREIRSTVPVGDAAAHVFYGRDDQRLRRTSGSWPI